MDLKEGINEYSVDINKHKISFKCKYNPDSDEVVLFIHGLACSSDSFRNAFDQNYFQNKSLLIPDLAGFGKSSKLENFSYTIDAHAAVIEELLSILPRWDINVAAHSMGGAIALLFQPGTFSRINSFANIEGNLISEDCGALSRGIASISYSEYRDSLYKKQLIEFRNHPQLHFDETTPFAVYNSTVSLVEWSNKGKLLDKFKNLGIKKCYLYGEENKDMPILEKLDSIPEFMIHNSGHGMMTENPKEFYTMLAEFICSNS